METTRDSVTPREPPEPPILAQLPLFPPPGDDPVPLLPPQTLSLPLGAPQPLPRAPNTPPLHPRHPRMAQSLQGGPLQPPSSRGTPSSGTPEPRRGSQGPIAPHSPLMVSPSTPSSPISVTISRSKTGGGQGV